MCHYSFSSLYHVVESIPVLLRIKKRIACPSSTALSAISSSFCLLLLLVNLENRTLFEKDAKGQRNAVTINITGLGETKVEAVEDVEIIDMFEGNSNES